MTKDYHEIGLSGDGHTDEKPQRLSRRALLRAGATAMPVVLTLQSGEALARTSNLVSASAPPLDGSDVLCLDTTYATELDSGKYDLGSSGTGYIPLRQDRTYHPFNVSGGRSSDMGQTADYICNASGSWEFKPGTGGWCRVDLPQNNIVVSAVALNSVSSRITIVDTSNINIIC